MFTPHTFTTSEISQLWSVYISNSMFKAHLQYFLTHCDDPDIESVLDHALRLGKKILKGSSELLEGAGYPIPVAFTEKDVNLSARRLYSDHFYLYNIQNLAQYGLTAHSLSLSSTGQADVRRFFSECVAQTMELYNRSTDLLIKKGLYPAQPVIPAQKQVNFAESKKFLTGWFGERRPLSVIEINHLYSNLIATSLDRTVCMSFSQTAKSKEIRAYFLKGSQFSRGHISLLQKVLSENELPSIHTFETEVTNSTDPPFSDKLMMYKVASLGIIASARYGIALGEGGRRDIGAHYAKMIADQLKYSNEGAKMMINNGWMEQPPMTVDREALARV